MADDTGSQDFKSACKRNDLLAKKEIADSLKALQGQDEYADLTVICGPLTFKVHKAVLCMRSDFFKAACRKDSFKEGEESIIRLQAASGDENAEDVDETACDDPEAIRVMIHYLYNLEYPKDVKAALDEDHLARSIKLDAHAKIFAAATKYGIKSLQVLSAAYFKRRTDLLSRKLKVSEVVAAINVVFSTTDESVQDLRNPVVDLLTRVRLEDFGLDREFQKAINSAEGLTWMILKRSAKVKDRARHCYDCGVEIEGDPCSCPLCERYFCWRCCCADLGDDQGYCCFLCEPQ